MSAYQSPVYRNLTHKTKGETSRLPYPQTPETARRYIRAHGLNVSELARLNQLPRYTLVDLLLGRQKGLRGKAHHAAVVLGLKQDPQWMGDQ
jgi:gp16 family phage-associated protein